MLFFCLVEYFRSYSGFRNYSSKRYQTDQTIALKIMQTKGFIEIYLQEGEYPSIFVPMYDQSAPTQPNAQGALLSSSTSQTNAVYQSPGTLTVMPVQYPSTSYANPQAIYPGQIVYTPEQYGASQTTHQPQIPYNYPALSYSYPCSGNVNHYKV